MIVSRSDQAISEIGVFTDLYGHEGSWMDWALEKLGHPALNNLFIDETEGDSSPNLGQETDT